MGIQSCVLYSKLFQFPDQNFRKVKLTFCCRYTFHILIARRLYGNVPHKPLFYLHLFFSFRFYLELFYKLNVFPANLLRFLDTKIFLVIL